jgi:single-strand DNA-binding protein
MNVLTVSGNLGRDAEVKTVGQSTVTQFSVAARSGYGDKQSTFWINCAAWNKDKLAQYLTRGTFVVVSGELNIREYEKKDGSKGQSTDLRVNTITLGPKSSTEPAPASTGGGTAKYGTDPNEVMPF